MLSEKCSGKRSRISPHKEYESHPPRVFFEDGYVVVETQQVGKKGAHLSRSQNQYAHISVCLCFLMIRAAWDRLGIVLFHSSFFRSAEAVGNFRPRLPKTLNRFFVFFARHNPNKFGAVFAYRERRYFIISIWTFTDSSWIAFMISEMNSGSRSSDCPILPRLSRISS